MSLCDSCHIEEKVFQCCGRYPDGGESLPMKLPDGRVIGICPHLDDGGKCTIYGARPLGCRQFYCAGYVNDGNSFDR